jgi:hypothetical protein
MVHNIYPPFRIKNREWDGITEPGRVEIIFVPFLLRTAKKRLISMLLAYQFLEESQVFFEKNENNFLHALDAAPKNRVS